MRGDSNFEAVNQSLEAILKRTRSVYDLTAMGFSASKIPPATGDLRLFQLAGLAILKRFTDFLEANQITYWLDFGTLLGAVRHQAYVPWDDDLDIAVPRPDYERLKNVVHAFQSDGFGVAHDAILRVVFKKSNFNLDVFPYDFGADSHLPDLETRKRWATLFNMHLNTIELLHPEQFKQVGADLVAEEWRQKMRAIYRQEVLHNQNPSPQGFLFPAIESTIGGYDRTHFFFLHKDVFPLRKIAFEGFEFFAPHDCHVYLHQLYGHYAALPQQLITHGFWENASRERIEQWRECAHFVHFPHLTAHEKMLLGDF